MLKKLSIAAVVVTLAVGGVAFASTAKPPLQTANIVHDGVANVPKQEVLIKEEPVVKSQQETPKPAPAPTVTATPVIYGEDVSNPGSFIVFDKQAVMEKAGIPSADQQHVLKVIDRLSGWNYKSNTRAGQTLCDILQRKVRYTNYSLLKDDPIEQLKWCNNYVLNYGHVSWENAAKTVEETGQL